MAAATAALTLPTATQLTGRTEAATARCCIAAKTAIIMLFKQYNNKSNNNVNGSSSSSASCRFLVGFVCIYFASAVLYKTKANVRNVD